MRSMLAGILVVLAAAPAALRAADAVDALGDALPKGAVQRLGTRRLQFAGGVTDYVYLPDGRAVVLLGKEIEIWDMATGVRRTRHRICNEALRSVDLRPDGQALLFAGAKGNIREWSLPRKKQIRCWPTKQKKLNHACYSPDGRRALTTGEVPPTIKEWDLTTGEQRFTANSSMDFVTMAVYGADGKTAWAGGGFRHTLEHHDLTTGKCLRTLWPDYRVYTMKRSREGKRILVGSRHHGTEWRERDYQRLGRFTGHHGHAVPSIAYCRDPNMILTGSRDGSIRRWDRHRPGKYLARWWPHQGHVRRMRVSPDGKWVLSYGNGLLVETSIVDGRPRIEWDRHQGPVETVAWLPSGERVVSGSSDGTLRVWNAATGKTVRTIDADKLGVFSITVSPDAKRIAAGGKAGTVREFETRTGKPIHERTGHRGWVRGLHYTSDGGRLLSCADDGAIRVWAEDQDEPVCTLSGHLGGVLSVDIAADGRRAISAGRDGTVRVWDLSTGEQLRLLESHRGWVSSAVFLPDGKRALSGGRDGRLLLWDLATGRVVRELSHGAWIRSAACRGQLAFSAGDDRKVMVWDLATGKRRRVFDGHVGTIRDLSLSPDKSRLVSASEDTTLLVWGLHPR